jgi:hypothetical protein
MDGLTYAEDIRDRDPGPNHRGEFKKGWKAAVDGSEYTEKTLNELTWNNLGYRLGRLFGETSPEQMEQMYEWCKNQYRSKSQ